MKHVYVRAATEEDIPKFVEWSGQNPHFDAAVMGYPSTFTLVAYDGNGPLAFMPVQQPFYMEAISFKPDSSDFEKALAMKELTHALITYCHAKGSGEIYFVGTNEGTNKFAASQAFEEMPFKVYRVKLHQLEGKHVQTL